jgi:hypothetical protein
MRRITAVEPLDGFVLRLDLTDGSTVEVDVAPYLWGPVFEPVRTDRSFFEQVAVDPVSKTVCWPNGADIDPDVLVNGMEPARPMPRPA